MLPSVVDPDAKNHVDDVVVEQTDCAQPAEPLTISFTVTPPPSSSTWLANHGPCSIVDGTTVS